MNPELLRISINKALESSDFDFLEKLLDYLSADILENLYKEDYLLWAIYEYSRKNYEKAKYFAYICQLKNIKESQIILDLIECSLIFEPQTSKKNKTIEDKIISFLLKKSDDIFIITFTILKYFKYLVDHQATEIDKKILSVINSAIKLCPKAYNLQILKIYVLYEIFKCELEKEYLEEILENLPSESKEILKHLII